MLRATAGSRCQSSTFFHLATATNRTQEASERIINLYEDDEPSLQRLLQFLYDGDYADDSRPPELLWARPNACRCTYVPGTLTINASVYQVADKYAVEGLKSIAIRKIHERTSRQLSFHKRCTAAKYFLGDLLEAAGIAYACSTARRKDELRSAVISAMSSNIKSIYPHATFRGFALENPAVVLDVMKSISLRGMRGWPAGDKVRFESTCMAWPEFGYMALGVMCGAVSLVELRNWEKEAGEREGSGDDACEEFEEVFLGA